MVDHAAKAALQIRDVLGPDLPDIQILDIGAMIEGEERYADLVAQGLANVIGVEPDREQHSRLCAEKGENAKYLPVCLGDGKPGTMHETLYPGCSSLYRPDQDFINLFTEIGAEPKSIFEVKATHEIPTERLDDLDDCPPPDLLKIDVQGAELDILRNAERALSDALVLEMEVEFVPLYVDQPLFGDIQVFLREQGYLLHKFVDVAGRCFRPFSRGHKRTAPLSQILWADAIFVRDFSKLEKYSEDELIKASIILHEVYLSYDLVHLLLREHDRRKNTAFADSYSKELRSCSGLSRLYLNHRE